MAALGQQRRWLSARRYAGRMGRPLQISACRQECSWSRTDEVITAEPVFACGGCGSEWVPSQEWTPIDCNGNVPQSVQRERSRGRG